MSRQQIKQRRLKNAHVKQEKPATTVPELIARLTNKNDEYILKLRRELKDGGMNAADEEELLKTMLPEIITAQRQGKPANQLYGPVTVKADEILHTPKPEPKKPMWLMVIDQSLFFMSILAVMYGALAYFDTKSQNAASSSFVYLVMLSLMAGLFFVYYADWMQQDKRNAAVLGLSWAAVLSLSCRSRSLAVPWRCLTRRSRAQCRGSSISLLAPLPMGFTGSYSTGITSKAFSRDKLIVRFQHRVSTF
ncbi:hypothetical protein Lpp41_07045 [Lacticaseibacillus paracasei subsp. paracasei Lpp41]|uniref:Uncharacterized protein n=1 Tax=Lacticaseibacillus paracasei subsp. paracasei Lpp41 TaxID=1256208 RepID=A0A829H8V6_LACPA|nr:hypothetical protein Lpp41_07045 [Lacticaseibacillus paracasei subsp. paracasei Lpp41]